MNTQVIKYINHRFLGIKFRNISLIVVGVFLLGLFIPVWGAVVLAIFCVANSLLLSIERYVSANHDFELSTFSAVLFSVKYGIAWGLAAAILTKGAEILYNKNLAPDDVLAVIAFIIAAVLGFLFKSVEIVVLGIAITIIINIFNVFASTKITGLTPLEVSSQTITNLALNFILFASFLRFFLAVI